MGLENMSTLDFTPMNEGPDSTQFSERELIEIELLLQGIYKLYGYDFRNYALPSLRRRIWHQVHLEQLQSISGLQEKILHDRLALDRFLSNLSIPVTEMFRDPEMFGVFKQQIIPLLRTYPYIRIWHAGCSTGEEVYSMAIMLHEAGLYDKARIYATDMNSESLKTAKEGIISLAKVDLYKQNYALSGGTEDFSKYYTAKYKSAIFQPFLRKNIVFAEHNLVTDSSFNEFHVILCRNVMIYFDETLRNKVHGLLHDSLGTLGVLVLGSKESIEFTPYARYYEPMHQSEKIYRKIR